MADNLNTTTNLSRRAALAGGAATCLPTSATAALGEKAPSRPAIDFDAGFSGAAKAAGHGEKFDIFENDMTVLLGGMLFEDVGVTAYAGAAPLIKKKEFLEAAAGILAVEAYHMGMALAALSNERRGAQGG